MSSRFSAAPRFRPEALLGPRRRLRSTNQHARAAAATTSSATTTDTAITVELELVRREGETHASPWRAYPSMHVQKVPISCEPSGQVTAQDLLLGWMLWALSEHERHSPSALQLEHPEFCGGQVFVTTQVPEASGWKPSTQTHLLLGSGCWFGPAH